MTDRHSLETLHAQVAALVTHSCRLAHEQVVMKDQRVLTRSTGAGLEPAVVRVGLCPGPVRMRQLACAHTTARNVLDAAIVRLGHDGLVAPQEAQRMRAELERISNLIHRTDWEKNASEERYARLREQLGAEEAVVADERGNLDLLIARHAECVAALRLLHAQVLVHLGRAADA